MANKKLYYDDCYTAAFSAGVTGCYPRGDGYAVTLDRTAFYPEGGGQPSDTGRLGEAIVTAVFEKDDEIFHVTNEPVSLGETVNGYIDWDRRYSLMQHHTGEHIISGIIKSLYGFDNVGFHMGSECVTIDVGGELCGADISHVEKAANRAVIENIAIKAEFPGDVELENTAYRSKAAIKGDVRIVTIGEYDTCACCGLHCARTGEVGLVKIIGAQRYKAGMRLSLLCGEKALDDYIAKNETLLALSAFFSTKPDRVLFAADNIVAENKELRRQIAALKNEIFAFRAKDVPEGEKVSCFFAEGLSHDELRRFCSLVYERAELAAVFSRSGENEHKYVIGSRTVDAGHAARLMNAALNGRGGGRGEFISGTVHAEQQDIETYFAALIHDNGDAV